MIRVLLADDHHLVRQGIRALLEESDDIEIVGEAEDGQQAVEMAERLRPDVLLMDIAMPRLNGVQATEQVMRLGGSTQVVMLSMYSDETLVRQALRSGARGYLLKRSLAEELLLAVRAANRGESYLSPPISVSILEEFLTSKPDAIETNPLDRLTAREQQVMQLICEGHTNRSIANNLSISVKTVETHRANLMEKLDVHDLAGLVRLGIKHGLIFLDE
ncbi:MAG: response regulator transcription factor [Anaerolineales bacterium]|jgi:DNA-binding NarL/FixJ family response regulator